MKPNTRRRWWATIQIWAGFAVPSLLAFIAGCASGGGSADYGVMPPPGDPKVTITDFSYTPATAINVGDTIRFVATANRQPGNAASIPMVLQLGNSEYLASHSETNLSGLPRHLNDLGLGGDSVAGDLVYTCELVWLEEYGTCENMPVTAVIDWEYGAPVVRLAGSPLTVTDPEAAAQ